MVKDGRSNDFYELQPHFDCQNVSSLLTIDSFQKEQSNFVLKFCQVMSFFASQVSFEKIYYTFAQEPQKLFWARLKEKTFSFVGK